MNDRKSAILGAIINEHVSEGSTVASKSIVDNYDFSLSPATIRNEMVILEKEGYIFQPHTSAGRIPTEKGWRYYIDNYIKDIEITDASKSSLDKVAGDKNITKELLVKKVAKNLAEISNDAVFVGLSQDDFFYTGLSYLFKQPEFQKLDLVYHISEVVDHLDEVIEDMFEDILNAKDETILIGKENPFGAECSAIITHYRIDQNNIGVFGILGPMRMDYENNIALIKYAKRLFGEI